MGLAHTGMRLVWKESQLKQKYKKELIFSFFMSSNFKMEGTGTTRVPKKQFPLNTMDIGDYKECLYCGKQYEIDRQYCMWVVSMMVKLE